MHGRDKGNGSLWRSSVWVPTETLKPFRRLNRQAELGLNTHVGAKSNDECLRL